MIELVILRIVQRLASNLNIQPKTYTGRLTLLQSRRLTDKARLSSAVDYHYTAFAFFPATQVSVRQTDQTDGTAVGKWAHASPGCVPLWKTGIRQVARLASFLLVVAERAGSTIPRPVPQAGTTC